MKPEIIIPNNEYPGELILDLLECDEIINESPVLKLRIKMLCSLAVKHAFKLVDEQSIAAGYDCGVIHKRDVDTFIDNEIM